jgi:hypothetical protein
VGAVSSKKNAKPARVVLAAVTAWTDDGQIRFDPATLRCRKKPDLRLDGLPPDVPVWLDMDLKTKATDWLEPWEPPRPAQVEWCGIEAVAQALGFRLPPYAKRRDPVAIALERLVTINEMGVLRSLGVGDVLVGRRARTEGAGRDRGEGASAQRR